MRTPFDNKTMGKVGGLGAGTAENFVNLAAAPPFYLWPGYCSQSLGDVLGSPVLQDFLNQTTLKTRCISDLENQVSPKALCGWISLELITQRKRTRALPSAQAKVF